MVNTRNENQKIITNTEKLKKKIRHSGTIGIILGVIIIVSAFLFITVLALGVENFAINIIIGLAINIIIGVIYIVAGLKIRKNPTSCARELKFTFWYSIALIVFELVLRRGTGRIGLSLLLIIYIWMLKDSIKFLKRLSEQSRLIN